MTFDTQSPWLQKFRFDPITTGVFRGHYALQGSLNSRSTGGDAEHRLKLIETAVNSPAYGLRRKLFRLTLEDALTEENLFRAVSLCASLHEFGWEIQIVFDGFSLPEATVRDVLMGAQWRIIKTSSNIVAYGGNEYWYLPGNGSPLKDPTFPVQQGTVLYLSAKDLDEIVVLDFLSKSKYDWNILL